VVLVVAFVFWSLINLQGVALGVRLNSIATIAKLFPLLLIAAAGAFFVRSENFHIAAMPAAGDVARTSLLLIFAFAGIESALIPSGEVRDSERTVPRAIALAMLGITALYIALQLVTQGILGNGLAAATASPLADAAGASLGGWARSMLLAGASISMFGYLGGMTLAMPRMVYALARDRFLPAALARIHPEHRSPQAAIVAQAILTLALALTGTFERLAILANVSALALYFGCAAAAWRLGQSPIVPLLACGVIIWLLTGLTLSEWIGFGAALGAGSLVYLASSINTSSRASRNRQRT
jgi:amino acid transporter